MDRYDQGYKEETPLRHGDKENQEPTTTLPNITEGVKGPRHHFLDLKGKKEVFVLLVQILLRTEVVW